MCDIAKCKYNSKFFAHIKTVPQPISLPSGETDTESANAGRSLNVCTRHLPAAIRDLYSIPYRRYGARVEVSPKG